MMNLSASCTRRTVLAALLAGAALTAHSVSLPTRRALALTPEARIRAQTEVEKIFNAHRIWPAGGARPAFELAVPRAAIAAKTLRAWRASALAERQRERPFSPAELQREMERMARESRDPAMLRELFAALQDDPFLIAETLARPALAARAGGFEVAGVNPQTDEAPALLTDPGIYRLPAITAAAGGCDSWDTSVNLPVSERTLHTLVWTGSEMIVWGGTPGSGNLNTGGRYSPSTDSWIATNTSGAPGARNSHGAVWTGTEMIIWGGAGAGVLNDGARYNPGADSWAPMAMTGAPAARSGHVTVWTGALMIVWGGGSATGGRYDPALNGWSPMSTTNAPTATSNMTGVWSGTLMLTWGGSSSGFTNTGSRYDPALDSWSAMTTNPALAPRIFHSAVWSGTEMIVWGGFSSGGTYLNDGARYTPSSDSWAAVNSSGAPGIRQQHAAVWTGTEMIIWGGYYQTCSLGCQYFYLNTGGRYNPASNSWAATNLTDSNLPPVRTQVKSVWTGTEMIVWGGQQQSGTTNTGGRYNPAGDSWIPVGAVPYPRQGHSAVWTGAEMIVWGGGYNSGGRYTPATHLWVPTSRGANVPSPRSLHTAVWTGSAMVVWGGRGIVNGTYYNDGGRYDPIGDAWLPVQTAGAPGTRMLHSAVWSGTEMIVWGGQNPSVQGDGGRYDPAGNSWTALPAGGGSPPARARHAGIWTGTQMLIWGGFNGSGYQGDGARFTPGAGWSAMNSAGAPSARGDFASAWSGGEMYVWGGCAGTIACQTYVTGGARYNPAGDAWTTMNPAGEPSVRQSPGGIWTGRFFLAWGGFNVSTPITTTGYRYDPAADSWTAISATGAPALRFSHTAIPLGTGMIIWGGRAGSGYQFNDGGTYTLDPPASPAASLRSAKTAGVTLNWNAAAGAATYNVRRCSAASGACTPATIIASVALNSYNEADDGQSWFYAVESVNACGFAP